MYEKVYLKGSNTHILVFDKYLHSIVNANVLRFRYSKNVFGEKQVIMS